MFINTNQQDSNEGNNQGEVREEDSNNPSGNPTGSDPTKDKCNKGHIVIPYTWRLGESIKNICKNKASRPTLRKTGPLRILLSNQKTKNI